ncbi:hypothetical protein T265_02069 [Opisthorchis viverrini]|uniref:Reverse transcriptase RNase H-like domain-containing protein n=1 Tax=Opisthorchis viverrini TaxID=6198 RepID=A0A075A0D8_OPIVI|nr:hypothetical protein T265_02069 [Opisthorchis viverrini]KER31697.1 hypothetical protein T265_02069 [Opisthorchis viverrini]
MIRNGIFPAFRWQGGVYVDQKFMAILEQCGRPVICISRRLSKAGRGYSQIQREALAVYWAVKRLQNT